MYDNEYILTRAPHRVSFGGGGSDLSGFYNQEPGHVLSTSINRYVYVSTSYHSKSFRENFRIHYSEIELCDKIDEIKNDIIRECLKYADKHWGKIESLTISTTSDIPSQSGLGSSSAFCAALLLNLATRLGIQLEKSDLAKIACEIEIIQIGKPIGKQDQYATVFGGFNFYTFLNTDQVLIEPISSIEISQIISESSCLISSGIFRAAGNVLKHQSEPTGAQRELIQMMVRRVIELKETLVMEKNVSKYFELLCSEINFQTKLKLEVSKEIAPKKLMDKMDELKNFDFKAIKINGAGGGGFFTAFFEADAGHFVDSGVTNLTGMEIERIKIDLEGVKVLFPRLKGFPN